MKPREPGYDKADRPAWAAAIAPFRGYPKIIEFDTAPLRARVRTVSDQNRTTSFVIALAVAAIPFGIALLCSPAPHHPWKYFAR
jgi:hypothetical protein